MIVGLSDSRPLVWLQGADSFADPEGKYSRDLGVSKGISPPSSLFIYFFFCKGKLALFNHALTCSFT